MSRRAALMYHDIVPAGAEDTSGFPGRDAALYKVTPQQLDAHLRIIARQRSGEPPAHGTRTQRRGAHAPAPLITFDDGGASGLIAADLLELHGLRGYFFVTANYVGKPGFLDRTALRQLHARGHIVGSHSCSHPLRMGRCPRPRLDDEWTRSRDVISDIVGEAVTAASVPGGDFTPRVAETAALAGYTLLFTSEPTATARTFGPLMLRGRYTIQRWTTPSAVAALAAGRRTAEARQLAVWNAKKLGKRVAGPLYLHLRKLLLRHGDEVAWGDGPAATSTTGSAPPSPSGS